MSVRIFYAYRIRKESYPKADMNKGVETAKRLLAGNGELLYKIHKELYKFSCDNPSNLYNPIDMGALNILLATEILNKTQYWNSPLNITIRAHVKWDEKYWYFKFFPVGKWQEEMVCEISKSLGLENYEYQNSTDDHPKHITYDEYQSRRNKWSELTNGSYDFNDWFLYDFLNTKHFEDLVTKYHYTGDKRGVYHHLAYKFDEQSARDIKLSNIL
jgi:hypothetical protein